MCDALVVITSRSSTFYDNRIIALGLGGFGVGIGTEIVSLDRDCCTLR